MSLFWIAQITCKGEQGKWIHSGNQILPSVINAPGVPQNTRDLLEKIWNCSWNWDPGRELEAVLHLLPPLQKFLLLVAGQQEVTCSENTQRAQPVPQNSSGRSADCQMELGGSSGELQCKYACDKSSIKARLTWADCLSLPHSPIWKDSLDDFFQRPCSLSAFQREICFLHILIIWDIFILRITMWNT